MDLQLQNGRTTFVPIELLEEIFSNLLPPSDHRLRCPRQHLLVPVARVCKLWGILVEPLIYSSITIDSKYWSVHKASLAYLQFQDTEDSTSLKDVPVSPIISKQLLETLQNNARLADFVTELRFRSGLKHGLEGEVCDQAKILQLCTRVQHVEMSYESRPGIGSWAILDTLEYGQLFSLQTLIIWTGIFGDSICDIVYLSKLIAKFPELRTLVFYFSAPDPSRINSILSVTPDRCPNLQTLRFSQSHGPSLRANDLHALCAMCPTGLRTVDFRISPDPDTIFALVKCIRTWAPTLVNLRIQCQTLVSAAFPSNLFACLSQMTDVYFKKITFEPKLLKKVNGLENLQLTVGRKETKELCEMLEDARILSSLHRLDLFMDETEEGNNAGAEIKEICRNRGIILSECKC